jgi:hypothetical protein
MLVLLLTYLRQLPVVSKNSANWHTAEKEFLADAN